MAKGRMRLVLGLTIVGGASFICGLVLIFIGETLRLKQPHNGQGLARAGELIALCGLLCGVVVIAVFMVGLIPRPGRIGRGARVITGTVVTGPAPDGPITGEWLRPLPATEPRFAYASRPGRPQEVRTGSGYADEGWHQDTHDGWSPEPPYVWNGGGHDGWGRGDDWDHGVQDGWEQADQQEWAPGGQQSGPGGQQDWVRDGQQDWGPAEQQDWVRDGQQDWGPGPQQDWAPGRQQDWAPGRQQDWVAGGEQQGPGGRPGWGPGAQEGWGRGDQQDGVPDDQDDGVPDDQDDWVPGAQHAWAGEARGNWIPGDQRAWNGDTQDGWAPDAQAATPAVPYLTGPEPAYLTGPDPEARTADDTSPIPVIGAGGPPPAAGPSGATGSSEPASPGQPGGTYQPERAEPPSADTQEKIEQIKDLYLTAEAIGDDALGKHFDQLSQRQRSLIREFFEKAGLGSSKTSKLRGGDSAQDSASLPG